jgi:hypothetical protein
MSNRLSIMKKLSVALIALFFALAPSAQAMSQPMFSAIGNTSGVSGNIRFFPCGAGNFGATVLATNANASTPLPIAGVVDNLQVSLDQAPGAGTTLTTTLIKAGSDTTQTCSISDAATTCSDTSHPITFAVGETCGFRTQATVGAPAATVSNVTNSFVATTDNEAFIMGNTDGNASNSLTQYYLPTGAVATTTVAHASTTMPTNGTIANFYVALAGAPGTAASGKAYDVTVYKNGSATAVTCQVLNTATTCSDVTHTASYVAGDSIAVETVPTGTPTLRVAKWGMRFVPDINGESPLFMRETSNSNAVRFHTVLGTGSRATTETNNQAVVPIAFTLKKLYFAYGYGAPTGVTTKILTARQNSSDTALTTTIDSTASWKTDLVHTVDYDLGDLIQWKLTVTSTPPTTVLQFISAVAYVAPPVVTPALSTTKFRIYTGSWRILGGKTILH